MFMIHDKAILPRTSAECFSEPECENKCSTSYEQQCSTRNEQQCSTGNVDDNYGYFYHCSRENLAWRPIKLRRISNFHPLVWKRLTQLLKSLSLVTFFCPLVVTTQALFGLTLTRGLMFRYCAAKNVFAPTWRFARFCTAQPRQKCKRAAATTVTWLSESESQGLEKPICRVWCFNPPPSSHLN